MAETTEEGLQSDQAVGVGPQMATSPGDTQQTLVVDEVPLGDERQKVKEKEGGRGGRRGSGGDPRREAEGRQTSPDSGVLVERSRYLVHA